MIVATAANGIMTDSQRTALTDVTGIDHIYITVSELARSEPFYDRVLRDALGFRKNTFTLGGDPHISTTTACSVSCCAPRACRSVRASSTSA